MVSLVPALLNSGGTQKNKSIPSCESFKWKAAEENHSKNNHSQIKNNFI